MKFRANESAESNQLWAIQKLTKGLPQEVIQSCKAQLEHLISKYGPVIDGYPSWHPLVAHQPDLRSPIVDVNRSFRGVDHTVQLRHGFITCPYGSEEIIRSVEQAEFHPAVHVEVEVLDFPLYHIDAKPILVTCEWQKIPLKDDGSIPTGLAVPLMLEMELKGWLNAEVAETWETMRNYILGRPCGARSSLFVDAETGLALKKVYTALMQSGAYGEFYER